MRTACASGDPAEKKLQHCEILSLKGAVVMTCPLCVASSGAGPRRVNAALRLGLHHRLWVTLVTLMQRDRIGSLTGLVWEVDTEGSPIAYWPPDTHHHVDS